MTIEKYVLHTKRPLHYSASYSIPFYFNDKFHMTVVQLRPYNGSILIFPFDKSFSVFTVEKLLQFLKKYPGNL